MNTNLFLILTPHLFSVFAAIREYSCSFVAKTLPLKVYRFRLMSGNRGNAPCNDETARDHASRFGVGASREAGLFASDTDRELTGLDDALAFVVNDRHSLGAERERDGLLFPRLEKDSLDPGQRSDRRRNRSGHVGHIQLNDFIAGAVAGVAHVHADLDALACRRRLRAQLQIFILEARVAQPEPELNALAALALAISARFRRLRRQPPD